MLKIFIIILFSLLLNACINPVIGISATATVLTTQNDRRSIGTIVDDKALYLRLINVVNEDALLKDAHLNFLTYNGRVLVTGEVADEESKSRIEKLISDEIPQILKVVNETKIAPNSSLFSRAKDSLITIEIESVFYTQEVFHPSHIKVMTEDQTVYLMGSVTQREANKVVKIVKKVAGVEKIVKVFEYLKSKPIAEIKAEEQRKLAAEKKLKIDKQRQILEKQKALIKTQERKIQEQIDNLNAQEGTAF